MEGPHALQLVVLVTVVAMGAASASTSVSHHRDAKFLFASNPILCQGTAGHQGACLPYFRCGLFQGEVEGTCQVVGQCCVVQRSCGETSSARITYFDNKLLPEEDTSTCSVSFETSNSIASPEICQLHLTFESMTLLEPTADGLCEEQYLEVKGGREQSMKICGVNSNQTMVVDVTGREGPFKVSVVSKGEEGKESQWEVKVVQVPCNSDDLAPSGCDQYVTGVTGEVKSYNYDSVESSIKHTSGETGSRHLQETYRICVKQEEGYCGLKWTAVSDDNYAFTLSGKLEENPNFASQLDAACQFTDYITIAEAYIEDEEDTPTTIFCGSKFPEAVYTTSFQINVVANEEELANNDIDNRGFHLKYEQLEC